MLGFSERGGTTTNHYNRLMSEKKHLYSFPQEHSTPISPLRARQRVPGRPCNMRCRQRTSASNEPSIQSRNQEKDRQLDRALAGQIFKNTNKAKEHSIMLDLLGCWSLMLAEHLWTSIHPAWWFIYSGRVFLAWSLEHARFPSGLTF